MLKRNNFNNNIKGDDCMFKQYDYKIKGDDFMLKALNLAKEYASKYSGDRKTQVGATVYINNKYYFGTNHLGKELPEQEIVERTALFYSTMIHAEVELLTKYPDLDITGQTVFVTLFPCDNCARALIKRGVGRVIVSQDRPDAPYIIAAKKLFKDAKIPWIVLD